MHIKKISHITLLLYFISNALFAVDDFDSWQELKYSYFLSQMKEQLEDDYKSSEYHSKTKVLATKQLLDGVNLPQACAFYLQQTLHALYHNRSTDYPEQYHQFLKNFRTALETKYYRHNRINKPLKKEIDLLQKIAFVFYSKINMNTVQKQITHRIAAEGGYTPFKPRTQTTNTNKYHKRIQQLKSYMIDAKMFYSALKDGKKKFQRSYTKKAKYTYLGGTKWGALDPNNLDSLPNIKYFAIRKQSPLKPLDFIRMSTPTIGSNKNSGINPEFYAYITSLKNHGLKHVYVNMQDNRDMNFKRANNYKDYAKSMGIVYETHRAKAIEQLSQQEELYNTIKVVTLGKDNSFYKQMGIDIRPKENKSVFLKQYIANLFDEKNKGYYVPWHWKMQKTSPERKEITNRLLKTINFLFPTKSTLNSHEKRIFMEISFLVIIDYLTKDIYSMNITCKDGIDRAGATHALLYIVLTLFEISNDMISDHAFTVRIKDLYHIIFSNAISVRQREVMHERFIRYYESSLFIVEQFARRPKSAKTWAKMFNLQKLSTGQ
jgi:hypothetical protein